MNLTTIQSVVVLAACSWASLGVAAPWVEFTDYEAQGKCVALVQRAENAAAIAKWKQDDLDFLYACSKAGPVPESFMQGTVILAEGGNFDGILKYIAKLGIDMNKDRFRKFAEALWQGKEFYPKDRALLNKIGPDVEPIIGQNIQGQMRFPAKVFCGQSLIDSRHESIILDFGYTDTVIIDGKKPYKDSIDWIAGGVTKTKKRGLNIRDEIRMVKPGFYLGRAYLDRVFLLNFTLSGAIPSGQEQCWPGYSSAG